MNGNGYINFRKWETFNRVNEFSSKSNLAEIVALIREQKVAGELHISFPGNGGISNIVFREKEARREVDVPELPD